MKISIKKITLSNFRGVKSFTFEPEGENANIYGRNGAGKTTIYDAVLWLLFDKNSGFKSLNPKTIKQDGSEVHHLDHSVEMVLSYGDGKELELKKTFAEKWTKKRGQAEQEFSGHTVDYWVNGVPVKQKEYKEIIAGIADESIFKLLTSPYFFADVLPWEKRREVVLQVCGDITDAEIIASDDELKPLADIISNRKIDDHKKVVAERRKLINKELDEIPTRIDEATKSIAGLDIAEKAEVDKLVTQLRQKKDDADAEYSRIKNGGQASELNRKLSEVETELSGKKRAFDNDIHTRTQARQRVIVDLEQRKAKFEAQLSTESNYLTGYREELSDQTKNKNDLITKWKDTTSKQFVFSDVKHCDTCGQPIPAELQEKSFNVRRATILSDINIAGKKTAEEIKRLETSISDLEEYIINLKADIHEINQQIEAENAAMGKIRSESVADLPEYKDLLKRKEMILKKLASLSIDDTELVKAGAVCDKLKLDLEESQQQAAKFSIIQATEKRIEELKAEEKRLAGEFAKLEKELFLMDQFSRRKVEMLEGKINSKFCYIKFKMFKEQINGGLADCCDVTLDGKPFSELSGGEKIFAGCDCISTLAEYYNVFPPVFVDEAAMLTLPVELPGQQVVKLIARADDDVLRWETV